jgi:hypothetical protein
VELPWVANNVAVVEIIAAPIAINLRYFAQVIIMLRQVADSIKN